MFLIFLYEIKRFEYIHYIGECQINIFIIFIIGEWQINIFINS